MHTFWRMFILVGLILSLGLMPAAAQEDDSAETITLDGSLFLQDLMTELVSAYEEATETAPLITIETNGPLAAFEAFCNGDLEGVMSTRYIENDETNLCATNNRNFVEYMLAYQGVAVVLSAPETDPAEANIGTPCVTLGDLDTIFGLTAEGSDNSTTELDPTAEDGSLTVYAPAEGSLGYEAMRAILPSRELRTDMETIDSPQALIDALTEAETPGVGFLNLQDWLSLDDDARESVLLLEVRNPTDATCHLPSALDIETRTYAAHRPLLLYVAEDSLPNETLRDFLIVANSGLLQDTAETLGFTPITDNAQTRNATNLTEPNIGRSFSRPSAPPSMSPVPAGTVVIAGDPLATPIINAMTGNFNASNDQTSTELNLFGLAEAWEALCNDEADVIFSNIEDERACDDSDVETVSLSVGAQAYVFAVDAEQEDLPTCLDVEILAQAFGTFPAEDNTNTPSADENDYNQGPRTWADLTDDAPDTPLYVLMANRSTAEVDWLLNLAGASTAFPRSDRDDQVLYDPIDVAQPGQWRAEAVTNLQDGAALAVLSWYDYQNSDAQGDLRLLEVNAGEGCIAPSENTFLDGTYPLAANYTVYLARQTLGEEAGAPFAWSLLSEAAISQLDLLNIALPAFEQIRLARDTFFEIIEEEVALAIERRLEEEAEAAAEENTDALDVESIDVEGVEEDTDTDE